MEVTHEDTTEDSVSSITSHATSNCEPAIKRQHLSARSVSGKLDKITQGVSSIKNVINFMANVQQTLQCVVCRGLVSGPVVTKCCGRIIGCQLCINTWLEKHTTCPHCACYLEPATWSATLSYVAFTTFVCALRSTIEERIALPPVSAAEDGSALPSPPNHAW